MSSVDFQVAPSFPLVGLVNNGNTCYAYSILQVLRNVPELWCGADISNFNSDIIEAFCLTISLMNNSDTFVDRSFFLQHLSSFMREVFNAHNQHGVPEVLQALLNELVRSNFVNNQKLTVECRDVLQCCVCLSTSTSNIEMYNLQPLPVTPGVQTGVERFLTPELLTGDERWHCTSDRQEATTSTIFTNVPAVSFLQLRRFNFSSCGIVKDRSHMQPSNLLTVPVLDSVRGNTDNITFRVLSTIHHSGDF